MNKKYSYLDLLEDKLGKERKARRKMKVSGSSVKKLARIIKEKSK